jgi:hypothetical protein
MMRNGIIALGNTITPARTTIDRNTIAALTDNGNDLNLAHITLLQKMVQT